MIEALEKAFKDAQALPERQQQEIADLIEQKMSDLGWDKLLESPKSVRTLDAMAERVREERRQGRTRSFPPEV